MVSASGVVVTVALAAYRTVRHRPRPDARCSEWRHIAIRDRYGGKELPFVSARESRCNIMFVLAWLWQAS